MIKTKHLKDFVYKEYGSLNKAAKEMGITSSTLCRLIKGQRDIGKKTLRSLSIFCSKKGLELSDFVFFAKAVTDS